MSTQVRAYEVEQTDKTRWGLASLSLSMLMASLDTSIANVGLPTLMEAFGATFGQVQWVVLAYLLSLTGLIVGVGRLGDMFGRKRLLIAGLMLFTAASLLCGLAPSLWVLILGRAAQGLGAAVMLALSMALVAETVAKDRVGRAMGLLGTMSALGTSLGPSLGGFLIDSFGWQAIFLLNVPLGVTNIALAQRTLPASTRPAAAQPRFDVAGMLLLFGTLGAYSLAMTARGGAFGMLNIALLAGAGVGFCLFLRTEALARAPLVRIRMLADRKLGAGLSMSMLVATVMMATLVIGPFYLSGALALEPSGVGLVMAAGPLAAAAAGVPAGRLVDRFGSRTVTLAALSGLTTGLVTLSIMPGVLGVAGYVASIMVVTTSYALFQTANNTSVMADASADERGVVSGMLSLSRNLGLITGASAMGALFAYASSAPDVTSAQPHAVAAGMQTTFLTAALVSLGALAIAAYTGRASVRP